MNVTQQSHHLDDSTLRRLQSSPVELYTSPSLGVVEASLQILSHYTYTLSKGSKCVKLAVKRWHSMTSPATSYADTARDRRMNDVMMTPVSRMPPSRAA